MPRSNEPQTGQSNSDTGGEFWSRVADLESGSSVGLNEVVMAEKTARGDLAEYGQIANEA
jgi:hypothetical protein